MIKYWENETPQEVKTDRNTLRYYQKAGKLAVSRPDWEEDNGKMKPGKTVTLDVSALKEESPEAKAVARSIFADVLAALGQQENN